MWHPSFPASAAGRCRHLGSDISRRNLVILPSPCSRSSPLSISVLNKQTRGIWYTPNVAQSPPLSNTVVTPQKKPVNTEHLLSMSSLQLLAAICLSSVPGISCKWSHATHDSLCLASLTTFQILSSMFKDLCDDPALVWLIQVNLLVLRATGE